MTVSTTPSLVWAHRQRSMLGNGQRLRIDPGTGPDRYQRALSALRESGHQIAFASFTFDPADSGSLVIVPEMLEERFHHTPHANGSSLPHGKVVSDGTSDWREGMKNALEAIDADSVEKVVLTRQMGLQFDGEIPLREVVRRLRSTQEDCYTFLVDGLIGASPELLVSLEKGMISSLALAGTAPIAESLGSEKMDLEHLLAASSVQAGIARHVTTLESPTRSVLEFGEIKHLATRFEGRAITGATVLDVLGTLHPTASVAGAPTDAAMRLIRTIEPQPRGRYAGPVGWFNAEGEGEFALALRCGQVSGRSVTLYAGGGIVHGSDSDSEFAETELKLRPMLQALEIV